jgi:hypothetical protein
MQELQLLMRIIVNGIQNLFEKRLSEANCPNNNTKCISVEYLFTVEENLI